MKAKFTKVKQSFTPLELTITIECMEDLIWLHTLFNYFNSRIVANKVNIEEAKYLLNLDSEKNPNVVIDMMREHIAEHNFEIASDIFAIYNDYLNQEN